jgi:hypothetical protein
VERIVGQVRYQLQDTWNEFRGGEGPMWRRKSFWLALAAVFLPGGWVILLLGLAPERIRAMRRP